ncbi:unnamed protein product [Closterium sp. Naga37s-1]|nr:unnamed protein product [Closterium sp. Naga37s-1]
MAWHWSWEPPPQLPDFASLPTRDPARTRRSPRGSVGKRPFRRSAGLRSRSGELSLAPLAAAAVAEGYGETWFWQRLFGAAVRPRDVQWWPEGGNALRQSLISSCRAERATSGGAVPSAGLQTAQLLPLCRQADIGMRANAGGGAGAGNGEGERGDAEWPAYDESAAAALEMLERTGHSATQVGELLVVIGGLSRQGQATIDVLVFHLASLAAWRPAVHTWAGDALPRRRFRHTAALILPPAALRAGGFAGEDDPILFMFGGYDLEGNVHGMEEAFFLCLSDAGATATWRRAHTRGTVPSARFHHAMAAYANGSKVLVYGGEGLAVNDWDVVEGARQEGTLAQGEGGREQPEQDERRAEDERGSRARRGRQMVEGEGEGEGEDKGGAASSGGSGSGSGIGIGSGSAGAAAEADGSHGTFPSSAERQSTAVAHTNSPCSDGPRSGSGRGSGRESGCGCGCCEQSPVAWERVWNSAGGEQGNGRARRPGGEEGRGEGGRGEGGPGEGELGEGGRALVVYVLDVGSMTWSRVPTHGVCPGVRILHFATTYTCGASGREHMVIFGGYRDDSTNLETMQPYALNLASMEWRRARSSAPTPAHLPESLRAAAYQPVARNRSGLTKISSDTLLLTEGTIYDTRSYLRDVHALHLPSLSWSPVRAHGQPTAGPSGGLSAEGLIAYGGCVLGECLFVGGCVLGECLFVGGCVLGECLFVGGCVLGECLFVAGCVLGERLFSGQLSVKLGIQPIARVDPMVTARAVLWHCLLRRLRSPLSPLLPPSTSLLTGTLGIQPVARVDPMVIGSWGALSPPQPQPPPARTCCRPWLRLSAGLSLLPLQPIELVYSSTSPPNAAAAAANDAAAAANDAAAAAAAAMEKSNTGHGAGGACKENSSARGSDSAGSPSSEEDCSAPAVGQGGLGVRRVGDHAHILSPLCHTAFRLPHLNTALLPSSSLLPLHMSPASSPSATPPTALSTDAASVVHAPAAAAADAVASSSPPCPLFAKTSASQPPDAPTAAVAAAAAAAIDPLELLLPTPASAHAHISLPVTVSRLSPPLLTLAECLEGEGSEGRSGGGKGGRIEGGTSILLGAPGEEGAEASACAASTGSVAAAAAAVGDVGDVASAAEAAEAAAQAVAAVAAACVNIALMVRDVRQSLIMRRGGVGEEEADAAGKHL